MTAAAGPGGLYPTRGRLRRELPAWRPRGGCPTCGRPLTPVRVEACDGYRYEHYTTWRCPAGHPDNGRRSP